MSASAVPAAVTQIRQDLHEARRRVDDLEKLEALAIKVYGDPGRVEKASTPAGEADPDTSAANVTTPSGPLVGMTSVDAAYEVLMRSAGTPMKASEVLAAMYEGGWSTTSNNPSNLLTTALTRIATRNQGVSRPGYGLYLYQAAEPDLPDNADDPAEAGSSTGVPTD